MSYPNYYIAGLASKFVKVALGGAGGDELFAGYPWRYELVGPRDAQAFDRAYYDYWAGSCPTARRRSFFDAGRPRRAGDHSPFDVFRADVEPVAGLDPLSKALYFEAKTFLHGLLVVEDKVSMAHSLEARVRFSTTSWSPLARRRSRAGSKHGEGGRQEAVARRDGAAAAGRHRPEAASRASARPTSPGTAARRWTTSAEVLLDRRSPRPRLLPSRRYVKRVLHEHLEGRVNHRLLIWSLLSLRMVEPSFHGRRRRDRPGRTHASRPRDVSATLDAIIRCPACSAGKPVREGEAYVCPACGHRFPVVGGIPRLLEEVPADSQQIQRVFDFEHRRFQDSWYTRFEPRLVEQFLGECRLPREFFAGKRALDAGCGSGRCSYALAELGADLVAFDLTSGGIESAHANLGDRENVTICQANIFQPPFEDESFDFVMSWGVASHHTPDTRKAFERLVPLVKPGGTMFVMVYEKHSPVMFFFTDILRWFMRRLSDERRVPCDAAPGRATTRASRAVLGRFLMISYAAPGSELDEQTLMFGLFDAYSPRYNHLHTSPEVEGWFREAGFEQVTTLDTAARSGSGRAQRVRIGRFTSDRAFSTRDPPGSASWVSEQELLPRSVDSELVRLTEEQLQAPRPGRARSPARPGGR